MNYYNEIKSELVKNEINKKVKDYSKNRSDIETYYKVGKLIVEAQGGETRAKYGDNLIKEYSKKLTLELGKGYSEMSLKNMRKFYLFQKRQTVSVFLTWSHYVELLSIKDFNEINYYINISLKQNLSVRELRRKIKNKEYENLDENIKLKLIQNSELTLTESVNNPIIINNPNNIEVYKEITLHKLIMDEIFKFLKELGEGFAYIGDEYPIKIGNVFNYIDFLLFNIKFNSYVVVELKIGKLKKEHIGQIMTYMNYVDKNIKTYNQNKTIGIILCKYNDKFIMEYCSDNRIISRECILNGI